MKKRKKEKRSKCWWNWYCAQTDTTALNFPPSVLFIAPTKWTLLLARCFSDFSFACDHFLPNPMYHGIRFRRFGALRFDAGCAGCCCCCCWFFLFFFHFFALEISICWFWLVRDFALYIYIKRSLFKLCCIFFSFKAREFSIFSLFRGC